MQQAKRDFLTDVTIHVVLLLAQMLLLWQHGFTAEKETPIFVYPCYFILSAINIFRLNERIKEYGTNLVFLPMGLAVFLIGFCLINEFGALFWAFYIPRWFPVWVRILWYQFTLLLLHPAVFPIIVRMCSTTKDWLARNGYFGRKMVLLFLAVCMVAWLVRFQNISPDGFDWLKHSVYPKNWARYLREPLGMLIFRIFVFWGQELFHFAPYATITILTFFCGWISTYFTAKVIYRLIPSHYAGYSVALMVCTYGYTQIFVGNIEIYCLLHAGFSVFLYYAIRYIDGHVGVTYAAAAFAVLFCIHLSAGWWLPAFFLVPFIKWMITGKSESLKQDIFLLLAVSGAFVAAFWLFVGGYAYDGEYARMWKHFWSDEVMMVGTDRAMFRSLADYSDPEYYWTMLNEYFVLMPGAIMLVALLPFIISKTSWSGWLERWVFLIALLYLIYSITWHPDRKFPADWDIFSGLTIPLVLSFLILISRAKLSSSAVQYILYKCAVFGGTYLVLQLIRNHLREADWTLI